jgi:hypothetical protein
MEKIKFAKKFRKLLAHLFERYKIHYKDEIQKMLTSVGKIFKISEDQDRS